MSDKQAKLGRRHSRREFFLTGGSLLAMTALGSAISKSASAQAAGTKPNILVIFGDDIGWWNTSAYNHGQMGYQTPNIDRIADEGAIFTDLYAQQSCTAGRAAFITGQSCFRTGLLKVGLPGAKEGLHPEDPTLAELLKPQGYATGQFGKNHVGDRNEFLPTVHGFDEFFGNVCIKMPVITRNREACYSVFKVEGDNHLIRDYDYAFAGPLLCYFREKK